jgi:hypothetical protein
MSLTRHAEVRLQQRAIGPSLSICLNVADPRCAAAVRIVCSSTRRRKRGWNIIWVAPNRFVSLRNCWAFMRWSTTTATW